MMLTPLQMRRTSKYSHPYIYPTKIDSVASVLEQVDALPMGDEDLALDWEGHHPGMHIHNGRGFFMSTEDGHRSRLLGESTKTSVWRA
jgi:hypothetical protein